MRGSARPALRQIHLWLGLTVGLLFALLGLTGSALIFYVEIDSALHPETHELPEGPALGWTSAVWDRALATGRAHWPDPGGKWSLEATGHGGVIPARYYPSGPRGGHGDRIMVWFSADGSRVLRADPWGGYAMSWIYQLHMELLAGEPGLQVVGWSGFVMLVLLATGVIVWWPRGSWRKALAFKPNAVPIRRLRDLHKLSGLWSMALLFLLAGTGAFLALPAIRDAILGATVAVPQPVAAPLSVASAGRPISVRQALAAAHGAVPDARLTFIDVPGGGNAPFRARIQVPGDPHGRFPQSYVFVDQYSGRVLAVQDVREGNAASGVIKWIRPIHDGSILGLPGRILALVLGLVPSVLFITGLLHWRRRHAQRVRR